MNVIAATFNHLAPNIKTKKPQTETTYFSTYINKNHNVEQINSLTQEKNTDILEEISRNYDVRNATFEEICEIARKLNDAGLISDMELGLIVLDCNRLLEQIRPYVKGYLVSDLNLTPANSEGRRDWIAEFEARKDLDFRINNLLGYKSNKNIYTILKKLDDVRIKMSSLYK